MKSAVTPDQQGVPAGSAPFPSQPPAYAINLPPSAVYPSPPYGQVPMPPGYMPFQMPVHMPSPVHPQYPPQMPVEMPMPAPGRPPDCPPGLEYLIQIDQLLVHQQMELMEVMMGFETNNKYLVKNSLGQQVFFAAEENDCLTLQCCGPMRSFAIHIQDNMGQTVMSVTRPLKCSACCFPCCLQELEVQSPPGNPIGYVTQNWHPYIPKFTIQDEQRNSVLRITGPFCDCKCFSDVNFEIKSLDETSVVGHISKQWSGFGNEMYTDADNFGVKFPMDMDVKMKATILGACFLIDFMFFEHSKQQDHH
ncbi:hypothetical protein AALO_G00017600 [Alosa alosa]|uniref:Phospholipid scramblase n=1 Tax=Alosa alosa TaxID=278164 RepID=A0AAV6HI01_9TELE|nr:phospholipid scramblase 2-like isoform X1 [Alosa alosa]XP_048109271.1 phospholipid scramblase 2-like isoform X1 [Alosa alosa]KAG5286679.1 hypothetical protein AALO_G00017600 [Alosa alosa]